MTNREDIISMAIEAELISNEEGWFGWVEDTDLRPFIERFAALVAAAAKAEEREACAKAAQDFLTSGRSPLGRSVADPIHERLVNAGARAVGDRAYDRYEGETK